MHLAISIASQNGDQSMNIMGEFPLPTYCSFLEHNTLLVAVVGTNGAKLDIIQLRATCAQPGPGAGRF
eukprot:1157751-Pelagomonas_calceolata.AAC.12